MLQRTKNQLAVSSVHDSAEGHHYVVLKKQQRQWRSSSSSCRAQGCRKGDHHLGTFFRVEELLEFSRDALQPQIEEIVFHNLHTFFADPHVLKPGPEELTSRPRADSKVVPLSMVASVLY